MKKWIPLVLALAMIAVSSPAATTDAPTWLSADELDLAQYHGRVVLVDFWASWCKPCKESMPWLSDLQTRYGERGLQVVTVNLDQKPASALEMEKEFHEDFVLVHDPEGKLASGYELQGMPSSFLFDRSGKLVSSHVGFLASNCAEKEAELKELLGPDDSEVPTDEK